MENLLNCKGRKFSTKIGLCEDMFYVEGKIQVVGKKVYLCQDKFDGQQCKDRLGFKYSWAVGDGSDLLYFNAYDFKLLEEEPKRDGTPEDKAKEIYKAFFGIKYNNTRLRDLSSSQTKEASLISVGFIEQALINYGRDNMELQNMDRELNYWNEVKLEIQKL